MYIADKIKACKNQKAEKIEKTAFITAAFLMAAVPALHTDIRTGQVSAMDNRTLMEFPFGEWKEQPGLINSYLNDRIGFREEMITASQKLELALFHKLNHPIYQMGKNGWIYTREWDPVSYQHLDVEEQYVRAFSDFLANIQKYCEGRNADFCFFLAPNKETIYPENYPDGYGIKKQPNRSDRLMKALDAKNVNHIDSRARLIREKETIPVCNEKSDAGHWNMHGAFLGMQLLYEDFLLPVCPQTGMLEKEEFRIEERQERYLTNSFLEIYEKVPCYVKILQDAVDTSEQAFAEFNTLGDYHRQWKNKSLAGYPKILIFGDSYLTNIDSFFTGHFSEVTLLHITNMWDFYRYMEKINPDIVVIEAVERVIGTEVWPSGWFNWTEEYFQRYTLSES